jgi:hypothetical protein
MNATDIWNGSMVNREGRGVWALFPYLMPETLDEHGETQRHGRYAIAYSRDGWFVLDNEADLVLCWQPTEREAIEFRSNLLSVTA